MSSLLGAHFEQGRCISRVRGQNGISRLCNMREIRHTSPEPSNYFCLTWCTASMAEEIRCLRGVRESAVHMTAESYHFKNKTSVTLQWIPSHCGVGDNEEADRLSKLGSKLEQSAQPMSYSEAKTILRNNFRTEWRRGLDIGTEEGGIHQLDRAAQVTIFRLRTGHCQLLSLLHRLNISDSERMSMWHRSSTPPPPPSPPPSPPPPHSAILPSLR